MNWAWCMGMLVLMGVPAVVGGGIAWALAGSWSIVIGWEIILLIAMLVIVFKGAKGSDTAHGH